MFHLANHVWTLCVIICIYVRPMQTLLEFSLLTFVTVFNPVAVLYTLFLVVLCHHSCCTDMLSISTATSKTLGEK